MRKATLLITMLVLLLGAMVISAQNSTPVENWCDEGGKWHDPVEYAPFTNRCDAQPGAWNRNFMWANGWYGAQYDAGNFTLEELFQLAPTIAGNIITTDHPELLVAPEPETPASGPTCYVEKDVSWYVTGELFFNLDCSGSPHNTFMVVTAPDTCPVGYHSYQPTSVPEWPSNKTLCEELVP